MGHHSRQLWWDVIRLSGILATFALAAVLALNLYQAMVMLAIALSFSHIYLLRLMWNGLKNLSPEDARSDASIALRTEDIER